MLGLFLVARKRLVAYRKVFSPSIHPSAGLSVAGWFFFQPTCSVTQSRLSCGDGAQKRMLGSQRGQTSGMCSNSDSVVLERYTVNIKAIDYPPLNRGVRHFLFPVFACVLCPLLCSARLNAFDNDPQMQAQYYY